MRHALIITLIALMILVVGQNWNVYTGALLLATYRRYAGRWDSVPLKL